MAESRSESTNAEPDKISLPIQELLDEARWTWRYRLVFHLMAYTALALGLAQFFMLEDLEYKIVAALEVVLFFALESHVRNARAELVSLELYLSLKRKLEQLENQQETGRQVLFDLQQFEKDLLNERTPNSLP